MGWRHAIFTILLTVTLVNCAVIRDDEDDLEQGLYNSKLDKVTVLTKNNADRKIFGKEYAQLVQFYNSYCGHCRKFYPKYKELAYEVVPWKKVFRVAVIDCFDIQNNDVCREFGIMSYPTLKYLHENFQKAPLVNVGDRLEVTESVEELYEEVIHKIQSEQQKGRLSIAPKLSIESYSSYSEATDDVPHGTKFTFLVFEIANSTTGSMLILDTSAYNSVVVKRVNRYSELAQVAGITHFPGLVVIEPGKAPVQITPDLPSKSNLLKAIKSYLQSHNYVLPKEEIFYDSATTVSSGKRKDIDANVIYYSDLELTLKSILHTEINNLDLTTDSREALIKFLQTVRDYFPYKGNQNLKSFLEELIYNVQIFSGKADELKEIVINLEEKHKPYRSTSSDYIGCKGSQPKYRGYTCGLWTLFHTLTVGAALQGGNQAGPQVLHAMHGFVKFFFGCTHCQKHFQAMAERNRIFDVKDNDKAVLWLWVSHNEVNLRLAGDETDDPLHPKIQFPSVTHCPQCRMKKGAWSLPEVYQYLLQFYGPDNIVELDGKSEASSSQLSNLDLGMLSFLYILSLIIIIVVIKYFLTKRFYRKRIYKNGLGKV